VRAVALMSLCVVLGGCAARDPYVTMSGATPSGNWRIERQLDRITGAQVASAILVTNTSSNSGVANPHPAGLQLTCFEKQPLVRFTFEFKIGSDKNSALGYRFDGKPGRDDVTSRILQGYQIIVIEDKIAVAQFVSDMAGSALLYVRVRSLNAGRSTAEFRLDGAVEAVFRATP
jgi:hypothetical protein